MQDYLPAVQWMRDNGVPTAKRFDGIMTIGLHDRGFLRKRLADKFGTGIGFPIQIPYLHNLHRDRIESGKTDSRVLTHTAVVELIQETPGVQGSRITGAIVRHQKPGSAPVWYEVRAKMVVLATGGFQGSPGLTATYLGQGGDNIFVRSNPGSVGDGLSLATAAGAGTSRGMNTYYGHLLAAPVRAEDVDPKDYLPLAQYRKIIPVSFLFPGETNAAIESKYCLLLNEAGRRFADETTGDEIINQYLAKQEKRRGFILFK